MVAVGMALSGPGVFAHAYPVDAVVGPLPLDAIVDEQASGDMAPRIQPVSETAVRSETEASATQPAATLPAQERLALGRARTSRVGENDSGAVAEQRTSLMDHWAVRTVGALAIVIGLALMLRLLARSVAGHAGGIRAQLGAGGRAPSGVISVLARFPIARGQTLVLLRLDRRVLLLNQTPVGFATLTELVDAEEVASIVRKCEVGGRNGDDGSHGFDSVLRAMERDPEMGTGRLDGRVSARREGTEMQSAAKQDPIRRAQALLHASRRGNAAMGGGAA